MINGFSISFRFNPCLFILFHLFSLDWLFLCFLYGTLPLLRISSGCDISEMEKKKIELKLYNTMSQQKEIFKPITPGKIGMSFCLITADDISHLGHARAAVCFDILYRFLRHLNYEVDLVRNVTHLDDKLIEKTKESDENPLDFSSCFYASYLKDMDVLQCLGSNNQPRLRDHREQIVKMIEKIIAQGFGYEVGGDVFLSVDKSPNYGQLSGQLLDHTRAAKCDDTDVALWQAAKLGEPSWNSPWGAGRPGWHIECSAMSAHYMSPNFDIHGGGPDLILPHHEIVIAQACAACEGSRVNCWLQNGHVTNNDMKMGKPLDKFTIRDITDKYHPLALRHFLISAHYLSPLSYSVFQLERSSDFLCSVYQTLEDLNEAVSPHLEDGGEAGEISSSAKKKASKLAKKTSRANLIENMMGDFEAKMSEDLNTSHIHGHAFQEVMSYISKSVTKIKKCQTNQLSLVKPLVKVENAVKEVLQLLGLLTTLSYTEFLKEMKQMALAREKLGAEEVLRCQIDLKTISGTVVHQFEHPCLVLVEFVTPQDNVVRYVRKRIGESEHRAKGEFEIMCKLRGKPGVVQCVGTSVHVWENVWESKVYGFLMEFAVGGSLEAKIKMHPEGLPLAIVSKFTHMILLGLQSIHKAGYVHGDLHPGNILLFPREGEELEEAKVSDFGLSKRVNDISWWTNSYKFLGYPAYMSPESVRCGTLEGAHDIWAVGCLVLEMCTSRKPYKGYSVRKIEKELSELVAPKIPNTLPTAAMDFMKVCLATNPKERGTVAQLLEHQFVVAREV